MVRGSRRKALIGSLLVLSLVAAACGSDDDEGGTTATSVGEAEEVKDGGTISYAAEQEPTGFNNLTSKDNLLELRHVMRHIWPYAYLAKPDFSVEPTPTLAGEAEVTSQSPFTVQWKINPKAVWSDDVPVSSDDFEWNYLSCNGKVDPGEPTAVDEDSGETISGLDCASTSGLDQVTKFTKADPKTFSMEFEAPYVEYEGLFGDPMPPAHIGKTLPGGWNTGFDASPLLSAGPYQLKEWDKGASITLERNPKWWGPKPHLDTIVFRQLPDPSGHPTALDNDEVQIIYPQPQVDLFDKVRQLDGVHAEANFGPAWEHLDFNFKNPLLAVKEVRQAVAYGLDRDRYVDTLMKPFSDKASRLDSRVFVSNQAEYEAHGEEYATRSVEKATAALKKAGFAKGADGIYAKGADKLSFRLRVLSPNPLREQLQELIKDDLKEVGIDIRIDNFSAPDSIGKIGSTGDFDLFIFAWIGTPFEISGTQQIFASDSDSNFGKYANKKVDAAIKKVSSTLDEADRAAELNKIDEMLWEDLPNIPLFQKPAGLLAYSTKYANITDNTTSEGFFWDSSSWGLKATAG